MNGYRKQQYSRYGWWDGALSAGFYCVSGRKPRVKEDGSILKNQGRFASLAWEQDFDVDTHFLFSTVWLKRQGLQDTGLLRANQFSIPVPALPLGSCATSSKSLNLSELSLSHL